MKHRIVTISREFGSGGRTVGRMLADRLNISCYDSELIEKIALESGFSENYIKDNEDSTHGRFMYSHFSSHSFLPSNDVYLWKFQCKIIRELVDKGPCVIVGRCADYILKDTADLLTVFIHADIKFRADRIVNVYGSTDTDPIQRVKQMDKQRAAYHRFYTDTKWGRAQDYHVCLDSGVLGIEKCVDILSHLY